MAIIYCIRNKVNDKRYIGVTKHAIEKRFKQHLYAAAWRTNSSTKLFNAIRKHGSKSFYVELIAECEDYHVAFEREKHYIEKYNSYHEGYNSTMGGEGWGIKIPWNKGISHTSESKAKMKAKRSQNNDKIQSLESRHKRSMSMTGKTYSKENRDKRSNTWNITYPDGHEEIIKNLSDFCKNHGLCNPAMINVANGKLKQHKMFLCERLERGPASRKL